MAAWFPAAFRQRLCCMPLCTKHQFALHLCYRCSWTIKLQFSSSVHVFSIPCFFWCSGSLVCWNLFQLLGPRGNDQSHSHASPTDSLPTYLVQVFGPWEETGEPPQGGVVWARQQVFQCHGEAHRRPVPHTVTGNLISGRPSFQVDDLLCLEGVQEACVGPSISPAPRLCTSPRGEPDSQCSV